MKGIGKGGEVYGDLVNALLRRSKSFLKSAEYRIEWGDCDLALFDLEQSLQLYLKAILLELFGVRTRVHGVMEHLGILRRELLKVGSNELINEISDFIRENRPIIDMIDEAYVASRYEPEEAGCNEAINAYEVTLGLLKLLEKVRRAVRGEQ